MYKSWRGVLKGTGDVFEYISATPKFAVGLDLGYVTDMIYDLSEFKVLKYVRAFGVLKFRLPDTVTCVYGGLERLDTVNYLPAGIKFVEAHSCTGFLTYGIEELYICDGWDVVFPSSLHTLGIRSLEHFRCERLPHFIKRLYLGGSGASVETFPDSLEFLSIDTLNESRCGKVPSSLKTLILSNASVIHNPDAVLDQFIVDRRKYVSIPAGTKYASITGVESVVVPKHGCMETLRLTNVKKVLYNDSSITEYYIENSDISELKISAQTIRITISNCVLDRFECGPSTKKLALSGVKCYALTFHPSVEQMNEISLIRTYIKEPVHFPGVITTMISMKSAYTIATAPKSSKNVTVGGRGIFYSDLITDDVVRLDISNTMIKSVPVYLDGLIRLVYDSVRFTDLDNIPDDATKIDVSTVMC